MGDAVFALVGIIKAYDFAVLTVSLSGLIHTDNPAISRFSVCSRVAGEGSISDDARTISKELESCVNWVSWIINVLEKQ